jgi:hypothetical protein
MFKLPNIDVRRSIRTLVQVVVAFALLYFVWVIIDLAKNDMLTLRLIAKYSLIIIALGVFMDKAETVTHTITVNGPGGFGGSIAGPMQPPSDS